MGKKKIALIVIIVLIVVILIIVVMQEMRKRAEIQARAQQSQMEQQAILAALNLTAQREQIDAQNTASVSDWLDTIGNVAGAVGSVFSGVSVGTKSNN